MAAYKGVGADLRCGSDVGQADMTRLSCVYRNQSLSLQGSGQLTGQNMLLETFAIGAREDQSLVNPLPGLWLSLVPWHWAPEMRHLQAALLPKGSSSPRKKDLLLCALFLLLRDGRVSPEVRLCINP
ncbi:hypothetical protein IG631_12653 [Alternaria alternata]|nr:hypothetical protein IG631_12653 [Alternaria alternata]